MQLVSKEVNSSYIWFQEVLNDEIVIARCLVQYWQIFSSFEPLSELENMINSENIFHIALDTMR